MGRVLLDASVLVAHYNTNDAHHERADQLLTQHEADEQYVTDHVFDEILTVIDRKQSRKHAVRTGKGVRTAKTKLLVTQATDLNRAWQLFQEHEKISFTDATLLAIAESMNCNLLTFDEELARLS